MKLICLNVLICLLVVIQGCVSNMVQAIKDQDMEVVKKSVNKENINIADNDLTPLMWAAKLGNLESTKYFISIGADVNSQNNNGYTALLYATDEGKNEVTKLLLDNNSSVNVYNVDGDTPLIKAAYYDDLDIVSMLINKGASINEKNAKGETPFIVAVSRNNIAIVKYLISKGANVNDRDSDGMIAFMVALGNGDNELAKYLMANKIIDVNARDNAGNTPLHISATMMGSRFHDIEILKQLLEMGADVNAKNNLNGTPLMMATMCGSLPAVELLLKRGADPAIINKSGKNAYFYADNSDMEMKYLFCHPFYWMSVSYKVKESYKEIAKLMSNIAPLTKNYSVVN